MHIWSYSIMRADPGNSLETSFQCLPLLPSISNNLSYRTSNSGLSGRDFYLQHFKNDDQNNQSTEQDEIDDIQAITYQVEGENEDIALNKPDFRW